MKSSAGPRPRTLPTGAPAPKWTPGRAPPQCGPVREPDPVPVPGLAEPLGGDDLPAVHPPDLANPRSPAENADAWSGHGSAGAPPRLTITGPGTPARRRSASPPPRTP